MTPRVSVIVPAFNAGYTLAETIESVLSQTYSDLELIVIDDGSRDGTKEIVSAYERKDARIAYLWQKNSGVSAARNRGLQASRGEFVSILDADDLWDAGKLERQFVALDSSRGTVALTGIRRFQVIDGEKIWGTITIPPLPINEEYDVLTLLFLSSFQMVLINTALMPRQLVNEVGGWNVNMWTGEDWEFWIRMSRRCRFRNVNEPLFYYRKHSDSVTRRHDLLSVLDEHEKVIQQQVENAYVSDREAQRALIERQVETCGFLIHQGELAKAIRVLRRSLGLTQGWRTRGVWIRGAEILGLALRKPLSGA
jgi:glycosyltransferase involved in cell wall biosynthesis